MQIILLLGLETRVAIGGDRVDAADWDAVGRAHGEVFGEVFPAATMVVVAGPMLFDADEHEHESTFAHPAPEEHEASEDEAHAAEDLLDTDMLMMMLDALGELEGRIRRRGWYGAKNPDHQRAGRYARSRFRRDRPQPGRGTYRLP